VNSTGKFNSIVVRTLKLVLCFSYDDVPLKFKKKNLPALKLNSTDFFSLVSTPVKSRWTIPLMKNILGEPRTQLQILLRELGTWLPILLRDSTNLRDIFTP
jgi:hypothetical protein